MASFKTAQQEARVLRKNNPKWTVNVKEISPGNWGCRFSKKGTRDKYKTER
jgi:phenylpyruvate tautomerase PptA (4-oxalocrotonate tautomerase family)